MQKGLAARRRRQRTVSTPVRLIALALMPLLTPAARAASLDAPAIIVAPTAESRSELARVIGEALHGVPVTLADDVLTTSNTLSLEHANIRDQAGRPLNGRELSRPETFQLFKRGSRCVLVRMRNGHAWTLRHARCAALPSETSRGE